MNSNNQRIAIARACGWKITRIEPPAGHVRYTLEDPTQKLSIRDVYEMDGEVHWPACLPDYLSDLNAMHEAEEALTGDQLHRYYEVELPEVTAAGMWSITYQQKRATISATATQRAEAFLRTLNLYDDSK